MAFIPKTDHVVLGYEDGSVKIWNIKNQAVFFSLERMNGTVWAADVSADGKYLVLACDDSLVNVWNLKTNRPAGIEFPHPTSVKAAVFRPVSNGSKEDIQIASGDRNSTVRALGHGRLAYAPRIEGTPRNRSRPGLQSRRQTTGQRGFRRHGSHLEPQQGPRHGRRAALVLSEHKGAVYSVAYSPDGTKLASAGWDGTVRVWDIASGGTQIHVLQPKDGDAWSVCFGNDGQWLAYAIQDTVRVCEVATEKEIFAYHGTRAFHTVRFAPDGTTLAAGGRDGALRMWELAK